MAKSANYLDRLDDALEALGPDAMLVEELDGFVAGLLLCPEPIKPGDWLPVVYDAGDDQASPFTDLAHANRVFALIVQYYNSVARTLSDHPERYQPLLPVDPESGELVWQVWIDGFAAATDLRPEAWSRLDDADEATTAAFDGLLDLIEIADAEANAEADSPPSDRPAVTVPNSDQIAGWILTLNRWRIAHVPAPREIEWGPPSAARKVGRNDPCPCGSGKKYKRCCGMT